jgi:hypothetical protein
MNDEALNVNYNKESKVIHAFYDVIKQKNIKSCLDFAIYIKIRISNVYFISHMEILLIFI